MSKPKLSYFDFNGGRGEDCRLALHVAGVDFEDDRIKGANWPEKKADTPYGAMPVLEIHGKKIAQSNAILSLIGRMHDLHPKDPLDAAQHDAMLNAVEDLRSRLAPSLREKDDEKKKAMRQELAEGYMKNWGANVEAQIGEGPFMAGEQLNVADLKLFNVMQWFAKGGVDHIPADVFSSYPKMSALYEAVKSHDKVVEWYENH